MLNDSGVYGNTVLLLLLILLWYESQKSDNTI